MNRRYVERQGEEWITGNGAVRLTVGPGPGGGPALRSLVAESVPGVDWAPADGAGALAPVVEVAGSHGLQFVGGEAEEDGAGLCLRYVGPGGLNVLHHLRCAARNPVVTSRLELRNCTGQAVHDITRGDALGLTLGLSAHQPRVSYLLGWLDGPRVEAPGRPPAAVRHHGWLDKLIYGDRPTLLQELPPGGWATPTLRLIQERLERLPLRSGARATWDNFPWATVLDPGRQAGFFLGFEWSGTWRIDLAHDQQAGAVSLSVATDTYSHTLAPGETLTSPPAFLGLFAGDWDEGFNASRRYAREEILPPPPSGFPFVHYVFFPWGLTGNELYHPEHGGDVRRRLYDIVDAAADMGAESFLLDTVWWQTPAAARGETDFSRGLGTFDEDRALFPDGLRAVSDYVHRKGMVFGLWFEFERVDIRTANQGRNPWRPEWLVHRNGHPYRSWGQHFYMLCLGVRAAAEWALENLSWAVREHGVDWFMIDSNEWGVCQDPTHDHGAGDGEWAQINGLYHVLRGLRQQFPHLLIDNGAGGAQRGDFGMARLCDVMPCSDINVPSALNRQYSHGYGALYPLYYARQAVYYYPVRETGPLSKIDPDPYAGTYNALGFGPDLTPERMEWRMLNRMMGVFQPIYDLSQVPAPHLQALRKATATYRKLRPSLHGDRYVLAGPSVLVERGNRESDRWEVYQHLSLDQRLVSVFFFRCRSPQDEYRAVLRGLDARAQYRAESHGGRVQGVFRGAELMERGLVCRLPGERCAEVVVLSREEG